MKRDFSVHGSGPGEIAIGAAVVAFIGWGIYLHITEGEKYEPAPKQPTYEQQFGYEQPYEREWGR